MSKIVAFLEILKNDGLHGCVELHARSLVLWKWSLDKLTQYNIYTYMYVGGNCPTCKKSYPPPACPPTLSEIKKKMGIFLYKVVKTYDFLKVLNPEVPGQNQWLFWGFCLPHWPHEGISQWKLPSLPIKHEWYQEKWGLALYKVAKTYDSLKINQGEKYVLPPSTS